MMKYNLGSTIETSQVYAEIARLAKEKAIVEVRKIKPRRSLNQNNYLHLLLGAFGSHFGYTLEEAKSIYKQLNAPIYEYSKDIRGKTMQFVRSSANLDKAEMTKSIETFREWSARAGFPLPSATDQEWLRQIENEIERNGSYL